MEVLKELSIEYNKLSETDLKRTNLLNSVGGKLRSTQLDALLRQWSMYEEMLQQYEAGSNSMAREAEKTANSLEGSLNRLSNTWTDTIENIANSESLTNIVNGLNGILTSINNITKTLGGAGSILAGTALFAGLKNVGVFKVVDNNLTTIFNKTQSVSNGFNLASDSVGRFVDGFNRLNTQQNFGSRWDSFINGATSANGNMAAYFEDLAKQGASARASIEGVYAAILNGNTKGLSNVKSIISTFNSLNPENQKAFASAVGQTNAQLGGYLTNLQGSSASLRGYTVQLVATTVKTLALKAASIALNMALATGISWLINKGIQAWQDWYQSQEELRESARETAKTINDQTNEMKQLVSQYEKILDSEKTESEKTEELNKWKQTLAETYGFEKDKLAELNTEREKGIELLNAEIDAENSKKRGEWLAEYANQFEKAKSLIENPEWDGGTDGIVQTSFFKRIDSKNIRDSIAEQFTIDDVEGTFDFSGDNLIETYENLKNILSIMGNAKDLSYDEKNLLDKLNKEEASIKKVLDEYLSIYETGYDYKALNSFTDYKQNNPLADVGKDSYISWRNGLLATAEGDTALEKELLALAEQQFPNYAKYFENLNKAKIQFGATKPDSGFDALKKNFLESLSDEDLEIAIQIPDLFIDGIENATEKIENFKKVNNFYKSIKSLEELKEAYDGISDSADKFISNQKTLNSAFEEQEKYGQLASSTVSSLIEAGYSRALSVNAETGAITLNKDAVEMLNSVKKQELKLSIMREKLSLQEKLRDESVEINSLTAEMAHATEERREEIRTLIAERMAQAALNDEAIDLIKQYDAILGMIENPIEFDDSNKSTKDKNEEPAQVTAFKKDLAEKQHLVAMKKLSEEEYLNWLDGAYKTAYAGLEGYEDDLYKYEEEIFSKRRELAEKAFDDTIDGIEKEIDALEKLKDNASLDINAEGSIYSIIDQQILLYQQAIDEIGKRIAELEASGLVGIEDEIEELNKQKDDLLEKVYDLGKERTSTGIENEISYWEEMQNKQNDFYDKQIDKLKKQKELLEDKNDEEERAKDLAEKQLELRKAQIALEDARRNRNVLVYTAGGGYSYEADKTAIAEAEENVKKAKEDLEELRQEEIKDNLDKQIEILEEQKDKDSEYYDTIIKLLEDMSGDNKVQSESNRSIWGQLLATEGGQKALGQIDNNTLQELLDTGFLAKKDGRYVLGEGDLTNIRKTEDDINKMLSKLLHIPESSIADKEKLLRAVSSGGLNSLAIPSQSMLSELTKTKGTMVTNYNNNKISNTYHVDKIDIGYSGDDFNGMLEQAFNAMNQGITINGNKVAYGN